MKNIYLKYNSEIVILVMSKVNEAAIIYLKDLVHLSQNNTVEFCRICHLIWNLGLCYLRAYIIALAEIKVDHI